MAHLFARAIFFFQMPSPDDFQYAMENTQVLLAPARRIETFGSVSFHFHLITELMDEVNQVCVRDGHIQASRPEIVTPANYSRLLLDGFDESAQNFASWLESQRENLALLKYGFQFRKSGVTETIVHSPIDQVIDRVREQITATQEPSSAIIHGVDDAWEVCLLKFTIDLVQQSAGGNIGDFRKRGLL